jgi:hypothetical protein
MQKRDKSDGDGGRAHFDDKWCEDQHGTVQDTTTGMFHI